MKKNVVTIGSMKNVRVGASVPEGSDTLDFHVCHAENVGTIYLERSKQDDVIEAVLRELSAALPAAGAAMQSEIDAAGHDLHSGDAGRIKKALKWVGEVGISFMSKAIVDAAVALYRSLGGL